MGAFMGALAAPAAARGAEAAAPRAARFTFGILGGKRQMAQDARHVYYLGPERELCVVEKPLDLPAGAAAVSPAPRARLKLPGIPEAMEWTGRGLLCVSTGLGLAWVDLSEPARPRLITELRVAERETEGVSDIRHAPPHLYAACRRQGLLRFDLSDPARPRRSGWLALPGFSSGLDAEGDRVVVATGTGLAFVRAAPEGLRLESFHDTLRHAELVRLSGKRLVFASKEYVVFHDLSDPARPVEIAEISSRDPFFYSHHAALHLGPDRLYTAATEGGLYVHEWKETPRLVVQLGLWGNEKRLTPERKIQYLGAIGLEGPREELERFVPQVENVHLSAVGLAADGERLYLVDWKGRLWAVEVDLDRPAARCVMRPE